jgi:hypothetical protein
LPEEVTKARSPTPGLANAPPEAAHPLDQSSPAPDFDLHGHAMKLKLAIKPPRRIAAGVALEAPLVVTLGTSKPQEEDQDYDPESELGGTWAFLSLVSEDRRQPLAPPRTSLMTGSKSDSVHITYPSSTDHEPEDNPLAYSSFRDIKITKAGKYCFMISLVDLNR